MSRALVWLNLSRMAGPIIEGRRGKGPRARAVWDGLDLEQTRSRDGGRGERQREKREMEGHMRTELVSAMLPQWHDEARLAGGKG